MKICIINDLFSKDFAGGAERYTYQLAEKLSENDEVFVVTSGPKDKIYTDGKVRVYDIKPFNVYWVGRRKNSSVFRFLWHLFNMFNIYRFEKAKEIFKQEKPDIIIANNITSFYSVIHAASRLKIPVIQVLHDYSYLCPKAYFMKNNENHICRSPYVICRLREKILKSFYREKIDLFISPSRFLAELMIKKGIPRKKLEVLHNFVESDLINKTKVRKPTKSKFTVLYVGSLVRHKGPQIIPDAVKGLDCKFVIRGDGPLKNYLERKMREYDIDYEFKKKLPYQELIRLYKTSDVLIFPSIWPENCPITVLEAMESGLRVIASDVGGLPELVDRKFLFKPGESSRLRDIIKKQISRKKKISSKDFRVNDVHEYAKRFRLILRKFE